MFVAVNHISDGLLCSWASCYFYGKIENKLRLCGGLLRLPILPRLGVREPACFGPLTHNLNCSPSITVPLNTSQPSLSPPNSHIWWLPQGGSRDPNCTPTAPAGSFKSQRLKEAWADHWVRAKTVGTPNRAFVILWSKFKFRSCSSSILSSLVTSN